MILTRAGIRCKRLLTAHERRFRGVDRKTTAWSGFPVRPSMCVFMSLTFFLTLKVECGT